MTTYQPLLEVPAEMQAWMRSNGSRFRDIGNLWNFMHRVGGLRQAQIDIVNDYMNKGNN